MDLHVSEVTILFRGHCVTKNPYWLVYYMGTSVHKLYFSIVNYDDPRIAKSSLGVWPMKHKVNCFQYMESEAV